MRSRLIVLASATTLVSVGIASGATTLAVPKLHGAIGPGFTISLKNAQGKKVATVKHGKYTFTVGDKSSIHNFTLTGPEPEQDDHWHQLRRHEDSDADA